MGSQRVVGENWCLRVEWTLKVLWSSAPGEDSVWGQISPRDGKYVPFQLLCHIFGYEKIFAAALKSVSPGFWFISQVRALPVEPTCLSVCCEPLCPGRLASSSLAALSFPKLALCPSLPRLLASPVLIWILAFMICLASQLPSLSSLVSVLWSWCPCSFTREPYTPGVG